MDAPSRTNLKSTGGTEGLTTFEMLEILLTLLRSDFKTSVFMWGATGIGKSTLFRQVLSELAGTPLTSVRADNAYSFDTFGDYGLIDLRVSLLDPSDLRGLPFPEKNLARWFPPEELPLKGQESRFPAKGILLLDEFTHAPAAIQNACYGLVLDRKVGPHELLPGWRVMAASNLASEQAHTYDLPKPLKNRFVHYVVRADLDAYKKWGYSAALDPRILAFLTWYPTYLHLDNSESDAFPTPRSWSYVSEMLNLFANGHRLHNIEACVGKGTAGLFHGFLDAYDTELKDGDLGRIEDIIRGKAKMEAFASANAGKAYAFSARLAGLMQADPEKWAGPVLGFTLSPAWDNLREIARSTVSDFAVINREAYKNALAENDGKLNALYFKVFKGMAAR